MTRQMVSRFKSHHAFDVQHDDDDDDVSHVCTKKNALYVDILCNYQWNRRLFGVMNTSVDLQFNF